MAKVQYIHSTGYYADLMSYLVTLDNRITETNSSTLSIDGRISLRFTGASNTMFYLTVNSVEYEGWSLRIFEGYHCYSVISEDLIYIKVTNEDKSKCNVIIYIKDNTNYYGGIGGSSEGVVGFNDVTLHKTDANLSGCFPRLINFALQAGEIAYSQYVPFASAPTQGAVISYIGADLLSVSDITLDSVISIGQDNYYAIGNNTIVKMNLVE